MEGTEPVISQNLKNLKNQTGTNALVWAVRTLAAELLVCTFLKIPWVSFFFFS